MTINIRTNLSLLLVGLSILAGAAPLDLSPTVTCVQNPVDKLVTVTYAFGNTESSGSAIITVDFETNVTGTAEGPWHSIGARNFRNLAGAVNREVEPGTHTITWFPPKTWPNQVVTGSNFRARVQIWPKDDPPDYVVFLLTEPYGQRFYTCEDALPDGIESDVYRGERLVMRRIHAAGVTWRMGSPSYEMGRTDGTEETLQYVTLTKDYYIGVFPFTVRQYVHVTGRTDLDDTQFRPLTRWGWNRIRNGADNVYYESDSGKTFPQTNAVQRYSVMWNVRRLTGVGSMDFPLSAQWEYACRAGTRTGRFMSDESTQPWGRRWQFDADSVLAEYAWYNQNATSLPLRVGAKKPNPWGLYDMYGLVYELCLDWFESSRSSSPVVDPQGPSSGSMRIMRGGAWNCGVPFHRSAKLGSVVPSNGYPSDDIMGFRLACDVDLH